jgi:hypothetical protein
MSRHLLFVLALLTGWLLEGPGGAWAAFDEFSDAVAPKYFTWPAGDLSLTVKGEVELELHDLEGQGGPGYDSPTDTRTIGTRSPFVEIDLFSLALRLGFPGQLAMNAVLEFSQRSAAVGAVWLEGRIAWPGWLEHHLEAGYHTPFVKVDRRSERYPLIGTIYWREPELHLAYEARLFPGKRWGLTLGLSLAMMRPLFFAPVQESTTQKGTIQILAYGPARVFSGNAPLGGGKVGLELFGAQVLVFGFMGRLAAEAGTDELRNNFSNYQDLPGYHPEDSGQQNTTFSWYGGRAGYEAHGLHLWGEVIASRESLLRRFGVYGQLSYEIPLREADRLFHTLEPLMRLEMYRLRDTTRVTASGRALRSPAPSQALTWDFSILTAALITRIYRQMICLRLEYYWIDEANGVPALGIADEPLANNEFLAQLEFRF